MHTQVVEPHEDESTSWASVQEAAHVQSVYLSRSRSSPRSPESRVSPEPRAMPVYPTMLNTKGYSLNPLGDTSPIEELSSRRIIGEDGTKFTEMYRLMQRQLLHEKNENKALKQEIAVMQQEFAQHKVIWTKKYTKLSEEMEIMKKTLGNQWEEEKRRLRDKYEEKIEEMRADHEVEMQEKEEMWRAESEKVHSEPAKLTPDAEMDERHRHALEALEKRHMEEIAKLKAQIPEKPVNAALFRKQPAKSKPNSEPMSLPPSEEQSEITTLRTANTQLQKELEETQTRCSELQTLVQGSFRKKGHEKVTKFEVKSLLDNVESEIRALGNVTQVVETLQALRAKIDMMNF